MEQQREITQSNDRIRGFVDIENRETKSFKTISNFDVEHTHAHTNTTSIAANVDNTWQTKWRQIKNDVHMYA